MPTGMPHPRRTKPWTTTEDSVMTRAEADEHLANAIREHADAYNLSRDDELLGSFAVIAHWQKVVDDGHSRYTTHFERATVPNHIARGLLGEGLRCLDQTDDIDEP